MSHLVTRIASLLALSLILSGCATDGNAQDDLTPADFIVTGQPTDAEAHDDMSQALHAAEQAEEAPSDQPPAVSGPTDPADAADPAASPSPAPDAAPAADRPSGGARDTAPPTESYVMDAMVGQVNGRAIYAASVLDPIHEQLAALGRSLPPSQFRDRAQQLIAVTLDQMVADALILGEAERELDERQRMGLVMMVAAHREELLRQYGQGSVSLAEYHLMRDTGRTLEETLRDFRNQRVVQNYLRQRLLPKINVTRRDIERYYRDHYDQFNSGTQRVLRLIRVDSEVEAKQIADQLAAGTPFEQVARDKLNSYRPEAGGLMDPIVGDAPFSEPALNQALVTLKPGEHAGPIPMGNAQAFAYLQSIQPAESKTLQEAQLQIDQLLREQQFQRLSGQYRARLFEEGSYNPIPQMTADLLEIAMARYAAQ